MPDDKPKLSGVRLAGYAVVILGVFAIAIGLAWRQIVPDRLFWSEADDQEYADAFDAAHAASFKRGHARSAAKSHVVSEGEDLAAAKERLARAKQKLSRARNMRNNWGKGLSVVGAIMALLGVVLLRRQS